MKWISVKNEKPPLSIPVLATDGNLIFVSIRWIEQNDMRFKTKETEYFKSVICTCCNEEYRDAEYRITHWMEMPKPPTISIENIKAGEPRILNDEFIRIINGMD